MIWLHGVSVGESLANITLAKALARTYPKQKFLLTSTTTTSAKLIRKFIDQSNTKKSQRFFYEKYPLDLPWRVKTFLEEWKPDFAIFGESELWPFMLGALRKRNIPGALINARLSERSFKRWQVLPFLIKPMLSTFSLILTQSAQEQKRYKTLGARPVCNTGNLKFAAEPLQYNKKGLQNLQKQIGRRPILLFASTHDPEEELAVNTHKKLKELYPNLLSIIVPRHPERSKDIKKILPKNTAIRSKNDVIKKETEFYLADTLGEMGLFYALCPIVFLGNSFSHNPGGGHNPLEPAHMDCTIVYGPEMFNFALIDTEMRKAKAVKQCKNAEELSGILKKLLENPKQAKTLSKNAKAYAQSKEDVLPNILEKLTPLIDTAINKAV